MEKMQHMCLTTITFKEIAVQICVFTSMCTFSFNGGDVTYMDCFKIKYLLFVVTSRGIDLKKI